MFFWYADAAKAKQPYPERTSGFDPGDHSCTGRPLRKLGNPSMQIPANRHQRIMLATACTEHGRNDCLRADTWLEDPALASPAGKRRRAPCHLVMLCATFTAEAGSLRLAVRSSGSASWVEQDWSKG